MCKREDPTIVQCKHYELTLLWAKQWLGSLARGQGADNRMHRAAD